MFKNFQKSFKIIFGIIVSFPHVITKNENNTFQYSTFRSNMTLSVANHTVNDLIQTYYAKIIRTILNSIIILWLKH